MKKLKIISAIIVSGIFISTDLKAQANWEVGVRGFDNWSVEAAIPIGPSPRLHPAVYFDRFGVGGYFDWMFALSGGPNGLKFFPGGPDSGLLIALVSNPRTGESKQGSGLAKG